ncbi:hypothetical protein ACFWGP_05570 [Agromyces sp. NPDC127015]|uniref:hypothetical protein n=1 Tax=Agromyces sp. NPDC127015 TaxID=3347108 RepID=UPI00364CB0E5
MNPIDILTYCGVAIVVAVAVVVVVLAIAALIAIISGVAKQFGRLRVEDRGAADVRYTGPGVLGILGVAFIVLKLCGVITWSWLWVLAPFWIPLSIGVVVLIVIGVTAFLLSRADHR